MYCMKPRRSVSLVPASRWEWVVALATLVLLLPGIAALADAPLWSSLVVAGVGGIGMALGHSRLRVAYDSQDRVLFVVGEVLIVIAAVGLSLRLLSIFALAAVTPW